jgi:methylglutaconyl-CoA hydratase
MTKMPEPLILSTASDGVVRLTLNRPQKRNALTREMLGDLHAKLIEAAATSDLRCLVLAAAGPVFCSGMDLAQMQENSSGSEARQLAHADAQLYHNVLAALFELPAPTIALVQGPALAGGVGLVLACDLVLAEDSATFALPEPKRGITASILTPLLAHRVGVSAAAWLLLSGSGIDSARAREVGLCHEVVAAADLETACDRLVLSILSCAPGALANSKQQLRACNSKVIEQLMQAVLDSARARETLEAREGLAAFLEKRPPAWQTSPRPPKT